MPLRLSTVALVLLLASPSPAAAQSVEAAVAAVETHFRQRAAAFAVGGEDLADLAVTDAYTSRRSGATHVYLRQRLHGVEVVNATASAHVARDGQIHAARARFVAGLAAKANAPEPALSAEAAVEAAARRLGLAPDEPRRSAPDGDDARAPRLVYVATEGGPVRLAWDLALYQPGRSVADGVMERAHWWNAWVDAETGALLDRADWIVECALGHAHAAAPRSLAPFAEAGAARAAGGGTSGSYNVFALPLESPSHGPRSLEVTPHDADASPLGWHAAGANSYTITRGNNTHAYEDRDANDAPGASSSPDGGAGLVFDFPFDPQGSPVANLNAAVTNTFYWTNVVHDVMWQYGFDEAAGNFQQVNLTAEGLGNDYVQAEALDGSGTDNANFGTPPDGQRPRMQMYQWTAGADLIVTTPAEIAGAYDNQPAGFGPSPPNPPLEAPVVLVDDGSAAPNLGCNDLVNADEVAGSVALIERGTCEFGVKVLNAIEAGAVAAIVYNCQVGAAGCSAASLDELVTMGPGATPPNLLTIPATFVQRATGVLFVENLPAVEVSFGAAGPNRDSDFDTGVLIHELTHGTSNRLTGGPNNVSCLGNEEQMGEGWSDYYGLMLTQRPGDTGAERRGIGSYLLYQENDGNGIRPAPYSTDFAVNDFTYQDVISGAGTTLSIPHGVGFAWATMAWDMTWDLIAAHGFDPDVYDADGAAGNQVALNLVTEGMKLQPCSPGFVDGRDAILAADTLLYDGAYSDIIWTSFARRGLGVLADQGSSNNANDGRADFTVPAGVAAEGDGALAAPYRLTAATPNPARGEAAFALEVARLQPVRVEVFDALGRRVALLHEGPLAPGVRHTFAIEGATLASGVYVYRATGEAFVASDRVTLLR